MFQSIDSHIEIIRAVDIYRTKSGILKKLKNPSATAKTLLPLEIKVAQDACIMLTANTDVSDGLVNGVTGKVTSIFHIFMPNGQPEAI